MFINLSNLIFISVEWGSSILIRKKYYYYTQGVRLSCARVYVLSQHDTHFELISVSPILKCRRRR